VLSGRNHVHSRIYIGQTNTHTFRPRAHHARNIHFLCVCGARARVYVYACDTRARVMSETKQAFLHLYYTCDICILKKISSFGIRYICSTLNWSRANFTQKFALAMEDFKQYRENFSENHQHF
jgi:hypothetical protein